MPGKTPRLPLWISLFWVLWATNAQATVALDMDVESLSRQATHIVHGHVQSMNVQESNGRIDTAVLVKVHRWIKHPDSSNPPATFVFSLPGGALGDLRQIVPGTPHYQEGDEVFLFLWQADGSTPPRLLGLSQGSYRIDIRPEGKHATRDRRGLGLVRKNVDGSFTPSAPLPGEETLLLKGLLERIQLALPGSSGGVLSK